MDIANQLEKLSQPLNNVDESLVRLNETVDKLAAVMGVVQEEESKGLEFIKKTQKLSQIDRLIQVRQQKFDKQKLSFDLKNFKLIKDANLKFTKGLALTTAKVQKFGIDIAKSGKEFAVNLPKKILKSFLTIPLKVSKSLIVDLPIKIVKGVGSGLKKVFSNAFGGIGKGIGGIFKKIVPLAGVLAIPSLIIKQLLEVDKIFSQIATDTGLTGKNLKFVQDNVEQATASTLAFGISLEDNAKTAAALTDALGNAEYVTGEMIEKMSRIAKATGMSAQEAGVLAKTLVKGFGATAADVESFTNNMMNFASSSGVNARKVMRDISNDSNLTSIYLGRGEDYLMKSAVLAAKMGKSLAEQNSTLDAFSTIESSVENVAEINRLTGGQLDAQKMFMMFQTQDTLGAMKELQKAFSNPRAISMINRYPGAFKSVASSLNLSVADLKQLDRVMKDFEKSSSKTSSEQDAIQKALDDSSTIMDDIKNIALQVLLPAFNNLGSFLSREIKPALNDMKQSASQFGRALQDAMAGETTFVGKVTAAFRTIIEEAKPLIKSLFDEIMVHLQPKINEMMDFIGKKLSQIISDATGNLFGESAGQQEYKGFIAQAEKAYEAGVLSENQIERIRANLENEYFMTDAMDQKERDIAMKRFEEVLKTFDDGDVKAAQELSKSLTSGGRRRVPRNAKGNVYNRPTLGLIGEEGRSEVVIPTERIRKGMPVDSSVAAELSSIGVPGFFAGGRAGTAGLTVNLPSGANINRLVSSTTNTEQERALQRSQGDPEAIRRLVSTLEKQSADYNKGLRDQTNTIHEGFEQLYTAQSYGPDGGPRDPDGAGGGGPASPIGDPRKDPFASNYFKYANMLNNYMEVTGTTVPQLISDMVTILPNTLETSLRTNYDKLSDATRQGIEVGTQAAWDTYIETGKFEKGVQAGFTTGFMQAGEMNKDTGLGFLQQITGRAFAGAEGMRDTDILDGANLTQAIGQTLIAMRGDPDSFVGKAFADDERALYDSMQAGADFRNAIPIHEENKKVLDERAKQQQELAKAQMDQLVKSEQENAVFREKQNAAADALFNERKFFAEQSGANEEQIKQIELDRIAAKAQIEADLAKKQSDLIDKQKEVMDAMIEQVAEANQAVQKSQENFNKKQAYDQKGPLGKLGATASKAFGDFGESIKSMKGLGSGAMEGAIQAFQQGKGLKDMAASAIQGGVGKMTSTAITGALSATPLAPFAPFIGSFLGGKAGAFAGKVLGGIFGGKAVKPKKARQKIEDVIAGNLMGVTSQGMQLSNNFREGSAAHRVIQANILIAGTKDPEKLYDRVSDIIYDASGIRYGRDKTQSFIQTLYGKQIKGQARTDELNKYESEMESGIPMRAGAAGAIVSRPTVALIGEAGPEALVPLENAPGARPLNGVGGDNGELLQEIKRMNQMLGAMANRPITLDGQRVNAVLNANNSDDIRAGIYTVNSR